MPSSGSFLTDSGEDPGRHILKIEAATRATTGDLLNAGQILRTRIRERTAQGIDANGAPFAAYSPGYAKRKNAALGSSVVDLFGYENHPHMLNALVVRVNGQEFSGDGMLSFSSDPAELLQVGFWDDEAATKAFVHNTGAEVPTRGTKKKGARGSFNMPQREFFAASSEDLRLMEQSVVQRIETRLRSIK